MSSQRRGGCIRPHQRDVDDSVVILGANVAVSAEHIASVKATERQDLSVKNKRTSYLGIGQSKEQPNLDTTSSSSNTVKRLYNILLNIFFLE